MDHLNKFVCIGAGNVATHLVKALCIKGFTLAQVYSRSLSSASELASSYGAQSTNSMGSLYEGADFYLFTVPDQALPDVLGSFPFTGKLSMHTAGSHGLEVFANRFQQYGVLYPLQTISKHADLDVSEIPFLIEACDDRTLQAIKKIAGVLSQKVYITNSESRRWIHLAAIFANNFSNHMMTISSEILESKNLDPDILKPLIKETFRKSLEMHTSEAQTGPAVRNDTAILDKHIKMLEGHDLWQKIYTFTSQSIQFTKFSGHKIN